MIDRPLLPHTVAPRPNRPEPAVPPWYTVAVHLPYTDVLLVNPYSLTNLPYTTPWPPELDNPAVHRRELSIRGSICTTPWTTDRDPQRTRYLRTPLGTPTAGQPSVHRWVHRQLGPVYHCCCRFAVGHRRADDVVGHRWWTGRYRWYVVTCRT